MPIIKVNEIYKEFKISQRQKGLIGTLGNVFIPKFTIKIMCECYKGNEIPFDMI